jgi:hypothetical protein
VGKFLSSLLGLVGLGGSRSAGEAPVQMVDPAAINFSMSTISDDLPPLVPIQGEVAPTDMVMHEDEWRQVEFFPAARLSEIQASLEELARFEAANRNGSVFRRIYVRKLPAGAVLAGDRAVDALARQLGVAVGPGPVLFQGRDAVTGRVENGFSLQLGGDVELYGHSNETGLMVLGGNVGDNGDHRVLTDAFAQLNRSHSLIGVDWRHHLLLIGVASDGSITVWRPD